QARTAITSRYSDETSVSSSPPAIVCGPQLFQFFAELLRGSFIQRRERAIGRSIVLTKELHHFHRWEGIGEAVLASRHLKIRDSVAQPLAHDSFISPQHRSRHIRGSDELGEDFEHLPDESFARPISHGDSPSGTAHSQ